MVVNKQTHEHTSGRSRSQKYTLLYCLLRGEKDASGRGRKKMLLANELLTSVFANRSLLNAHEVVVIQ